MGPILIFDKSFLESLNQDEACWLESFFIINITPMFFVETLADLKKSVKSGRAPEQVVGDIARKTPIVSTRPNVHHLSLMAGELMGQAVPMQHGQIVVGGGIPVALGNERGIIYKQSREAEAFERWRKGQFLDLERQIAWRWRAQLSNLNLGEYRQGFQGLFERHKPKSFEEAKAFADELNNDIRKKDEMFQLALNLLGIPAHSRTKILQRWNVCGRPFLSSYAPYTAHVFSVDLFFHIAMAADLISRDRPSNKIDMAYLYYLPFCMIFVSGDHLHAKTVPLFMREDQSFVWGPELKEDFKKLDGHYSKLPDEVKLQGTMKFASRPPKAGSFLVAKLWDKHGGDWRNSPDSEIDNIDEETKKELMEKMKQFQENAQPLSPPFAVDSEKADHLIMELRVPARRGKWRLIPPEIEEFYNKKNEQ